MTVAAAPAPPTGVAGTRAGRTDVRRRIGEPWFTPYVFILPHLILFTVMVGIPFFLGIWISLLDYDFVRADNPFVGLDNFASLLDPTSIHFERFWTTLWNTILFVLITTPLLVIVGLFLAALLNQRFRGRNLFRSIYFAPWTLSAAVVGLIWLWLFNSQGGLFSAILRAFGAGDFANTEWVTTQPWAWISIILATLWWTIGFNTVILLAGMQSISLDLYEAASIDGASPWQQFWQITVPSLRPVLLLVITLQTIASFNLVAQPQIITGGGPNVTDTMPVLLYIYNVSFQGRFELGIGAAMALVVAAIMLVVSIVNFRFFSSERA